MVAIQLHKEINVSYHTAWFMEHRIRNCFDIEIEQLDNDEADETYVGGKSKRTKATQGRNKKYKTSVLGVIEREGKLIAKVVPNTQTITLLPKIIKNLKTTASIMTDE